MAAVESGKVTIMGRWRGGGGNMVDLYFREHNMFILLMVTQSYIIPGAHRLLIIHSRGDEIPQNLNDFLESKCLDETKRERFVAFAISI